MYPKREKGGCTGLQVTGWLVLALALCANIGCGTVRRADTALESVSAAGVGITNRLETITISLTGTLAAAAETLQDAQMTLFALQSVTVTQITKLSKSGQRGVASLSWAVWGLLAVLLTVSLIFAFTKHNIPDLVRTVRAKRKERSVKNYMLKSLLFVLVAGLGLAGSAGAQDTNAPALPVTLTPGNSTTVGNAFLNGAAWVADYLATHGEARAGIGATISDMRSGRFGPVQTSVLGILDTGTNRFVQLQLGVANAVCYASDYRHVAGGLDIGLALLHIKQLSWIKFPLKLDTIKMGITIAEDWDRLARLRFSQGSTVVAATWGFNF